MLIEEAHSVVILIAINICIGYSISIIIDVMMDCGLINVNDYRFGFFTRHPSVKPLVRSGTDPSPRGTVGGGYF